MTILVAMTLAAALTASAQSTHRLGNGQEVVFPSLDVSGTQVRAEVTFDVSRRVYRYAYTFESPASNQAAVESVRIDVSGRLTRPQLDPALAENVTRLGPTQPDTTIPVGITVPDPAFWRGGLSRSGMLFFSATRGGVLGVAPGSSAGGFVVESRFPPALRRAEIRPTIQPWLTIWASLPDDLEFEEPPDQRVYYVQTEVIAPSDPDEATLFLGGGQSPAEVNPFLRYAAPLENRSRIPAGTSSYRVIVFYGSTTNAATFSAELNGADVTALFHPLPGSSEMVTIPLVPGTTKLKLSIEGTTSSGRTARDTDTLTFLVD